MQKKIFRKKRQIDDAKLIADGKKEFNARNEDYFKKNNIFGKVKLYNLPIDEKNRERGRKRVIAHTEFKEKWDQMKKKHLERSKMESTIVEDQLKDENSAFQHSESFNYSQTFQ